MKCETQFFAHTEANSCLLKLDASLTLDETGVWKTARYFAIWGLLERGMEFQVLLRKNAYHRLYLRIRGFESKIARICARDSSWMGERGETSFSRSESCLLDQMRKNTFESTGTRNLFSSVFLDLFRADSRLVSRVSAPHFRDSFWADFSHFLLRISPRKILEMRENPAQNPFEMWRNCEF